MSAPNSNRILRGWLQEALWVLLQIVTLILFIPLPAYRRGRRGTVFLVSDLLTSPLFYIPLRSLLIRHGYSVIFVANFNPLRDLKKSARRLSRIIEEEGARRCILVGHGVGAVLPLALPDEGRKRVHYLLGLGGCYHGTTLFRHLAFAPALRDIVARSSFLLTHRMNALLFDDFYPFSAWSDEWIVPNTLNRFGQGKDLILDFPGRLNLLLYPDTLRSVVEFLDQSHPPVTTPSATPAFARPTQTATTATTTTAVAAPVTRPSRAGAPPQPKRAAKKSTRASSKN